MYFFHKLQFKFIRKSFVNDTTKEQVEANYRQIKLDIIEIIEREKERITNDPELRHLVEKD